eukprot:1303429-Rhodomonas_salina.6
MLALAFPINLRPASLFTIHTALRSAPSTHLAKENSASNRRQATGGGANILGSSMPAGQWKTRKATWEVARRSANPNHSFHLGTAEACPRPPRSQCRACSSGCGGQQGRGHLDELGGTLPGAPPPTPCQPVIV